MEVYFGIAADRILVDSRTNQVSIIDVYEKIVVTSFPVTVARMTFLFYISRDLDEQSFINLDLRCKLDETEILNTAIEVNFKETLTNRVVAEIVGLKIPKHGTLTGNLYLGDVSIGSLELPVELG